MRALTRRALLSALAAHHNISFFLKYNPCSSHVPISARAAPTRPVGPRPQSSELSSGVKAPPMQWSSGVGPERPCMSARRGTFVHPAGADSGHEGRQRRYARPRRHHTRPSLWTRGNGSSSTADCSAHAAPPAAAPHHPSHPARRPTRTLDRVSAPHHCLPPRYSRSLVAVVVPS